MTRAGVTRTIGEEEEDEEAGETQAGGEVGVVDVGSEIRPTGITLTLEVLRA